MRATRAVIHLDRFRRNLAAIRERTGPGIRICLPVKAGAYGHGAPRIAAEGLAAGASYLAVATVREGAELRDAGIGAPVLLLSQALPEEIPDMVKYALVPLISDREFVGACSRVAGEAGVRLPVHLKIDTGMGRLGCGPGEAPDLAAHIASLESLEYRGTATHLAAADSTEEGDLRFTEAQIRRFNAALEGIRARGVDPGIVHAANSGALILHRAAWFDMVRPGILSYGYNPVPGDPFRVEPVMDLVSRVVFIKELEKGEPLSYGGAWRAPRDTRVATLPIGYGDGLHRRLSGMDWPVIIRGRAYPIVGRICMDQCMVDLGPGTEVRRWDEALIFGGEGVPGAADMAAKLGTIPYEIVCNLNRRVERVYPP
ncbi:MAG: alanine racemase [Treponema sp.]|jgi:alanine racemase|nr:alanine racemase [Treponema sp.]